MPDLLLPKLVFVLGLCWLAGLTWLLAAAVLL